VRESRPVVIFGSGALAELVCYLFKHDSDLEVAGFVVDQEYLQTDSFLGLPLVVSAELDSRFPSTDFAMFVAVSYTKMNVVRSEKCDWARNRGYHLVSYVSSRATTFDNLPHGDNCLILEDNTVQPFVTLGDNVFLWSGNHIGHHSVIEDDVFVTSHCVVSGNCRIGRRSFLGVNCTVQDGVTLGEGCFVGPRSLVRQDLDSATVLVDDATQAHRISSRNLLI